LEQVLLQHFPDLFLRCIQNVNFLFLVNRENSFSRVIFDEQDTRFSLSNGIVIVFERYGNYCSSSELMAATSKRGVGFC